MAVSDQGVVIHVTRVNPVIAERLVELLGLERYEQLADLLEEVEQETGYGHVTIIVSQGKVARLKAEKSY